MASHFLKTKLLYSKTCLLCFLLLVATPLTYAQRLPVIDTLWVDVDYSSGSKNLQGEILVRDKIVFRTLDRDNTWKMQQGVETCRQVVTFEASVEERSRSAGKATQLISIENFKSRTLAVTGTSNVELNQLLITDTIAEYKIRSKFVSLSKCHVGKLYSGVFSDTVRIWIENSVIDTLDLHESHLVMSDPGFTSGSDISVLKLGRNLRFHDQDSFDNLSGNSKQRVKLILNDFDLASIDINYENFYIDPVLYRDTVKVISILSRMKEIQKKFGYTKGEELATKELSHIENMQDGWFGRAIDLCNRVWWDYGYDKAKIIRNSMVLMLVFTFINLWFYSILVTQIYQIPSFTRAHVNLVSNYHQFHWKRILLTPLHCLLYTGTIFWGLKLDMREINFSNIPLAISVIVQYSIGIVCLAYLANYIIAKA
jgi:hypothetical protein